MKQHYLSRCYLKEFTKNGKLFVLDHGLYRQGRNPKPKQKTPSAICYEYDFYTLDPESPYQMGIIKSTGSELFIEQDIFGTYENLYPQVIAKVINTGNLNHDEARLFLRTLLSLKLRNKHFQEKQNDQHNGIVKNIIRNLKESFREDKLLKFPDLAQDRMNNIISSIEYLAINDPMFKRTARLSGLIDRELNPDGIISKIIDKLIFYKWHILSTANDRPFITSDNPGFCVDHKDNIFNTRFVDGLFIFPLTPNYCLLINDEVPDVEFYDDCSLKIFKHQGTNMEFVNMTNGASSEYLNSIIIARDFETITVEALNLLPKVSHKKNI